MSTVRFSTLRLSSALALAATLSVSLFASAQEPAPRGRGKPKRPAAQELRAPAAACMPECRSGYSCVEGECVSKCNPGCGAGERCSDEGECVTTGAAASKPNKRGAKPAKRLAKPEPPPADEGESEGNNWGVPPPDEAKRSAEAAEESSKPAAASAEAEVKVEAPFGGNNAEGNASAVNAGAVANPRKGVRRHDGFYMRLGLGLAGLSGDIEDDAIKLGGLGAATEIALGGTIAPGLVVGGGSYPVFIPTTSYDFRGGKEQDGGATTLTLVGPFVDYYPSPTKGLHVQGSVGFGTAALKAPSDLKSSGSGLGLMLGVGYEWWVGEQWSMGVLGRLTTTSPKIESDSGIPVELDASFTTFGLLATFTYH